MRSRCGGRTLRLITAIIGSSWPNEHDSIAFVRRSGGEQHLIALNRSDREVSLGMNRKVQPIFVTKGELTDLSVEDSGNELDLKLFPLTGAVLSLK